MSKVFGVMVIHNRMSTRSGVNQKTYSIPCFYSSKIKAEEMAESLSANAARNQDIVVVEVLKRVEYQRPVMRVVEESPGRVKFTSPAWLLD